MNQFLSTLRALLLKKSLRAAFRNPASSARWVPICVAALACGGCADMNWNRAIYGGAALSAANCAHAADPRRAKCEALADFARYEKDRDELRKPVQTHGARP